MILAFHTDTYLSYNFTIQYRLCGDFIGEHEWVCKNTVCVLIKKWDNCVIKKLRGISQGFTQEWRKGGSGNEKDAEKEEVGRLKYQEKRRWFFGWKEA